MPDWLSAPENRATENRRSRAADDLTRVIYCSRAVHPMPDPALLGLTRAAQARNGREAITGLVLYDQARFFQWLEGPAEGVDRVMRSIGADGRHTDIRVLSRGTSERRVFGTWSMRLAGGLQAPADEVTRPPREIIAALRHAPDSAPELLASLAPPTASGGSRAADHGPSRSAPRTAGLLQEVLLRQVIPELAARRKPPALLPVDAFTDRLLAFDAEAAAALVGQAFGPDGRLIAVSGALFEAAARRMGDRWADDTCSEFDITLGLCCLGRVIRLLGSASTGIASGPAAWSPSVLVAALPGEPHALGPVLHAEALCQEGFNPRVEHPVDDEALFRLLAAESLDGLILSLSAVFAREDRLPRVAATIARARAASRNPALTVIVSGRAVADGLGDPTRALGADAASRSVAGIADLLRSTLATMPATARTH